MDFHNGKKGKLINKGEREMKKRFLSIILSLSLCVGLFPVPEVPAETGSTCSHEHTKECCVTVTECVHIHSAECYPSEAKSYMEII